MKTDINQARLEKILSAAFASYNFDFEIIENIHDRHNEYTAFEAYFERNGHDAPDLNTLSIRVYDGAAIGAGPIKVWVAHDYGVSREDGDWRPFRVDDESIIYLWHALLWQ
jgi:hypothetical protein